MLISIYSSLDGPFRVFSGPVYPASLLFWADLCVFRFTDAMMRHHCFRAGRSFSPTAIGRHMEDHVHHQLLPRYNAKITDSMIVLISN